MSLLNTDMKREKEHLARFYTWLKTMPASKIWRFARTETLRAE
jgi:xylose isomerase